MHREFPPVAFLAALSLLLPLPWHWRARNVATLSIIAWLFVLNVVYAVDAILWGNNINIIIPVWCDITTKIIIGSTFALPAACLCICIHLERVASVRAKTSHHDKRNRQLFELFMCLGLPMVFMGLHYIVQGHRFDIIEEYGCRPTTYVSIPAIFLIWVPPLTLSAIALGFAYASFVHFMRRRATFTRHVGTSRNGLTTSRYFRLMLMAVVEMIWNIVVTSYTLWFSTMDMRPWTNWDDVHSNFSRVDLYASAFTPQIVITNFYLVWWVVPTSTFIFVAFFAFGKDAVDEYKACISWLRRISLKQTTEQTTSGGFGSSPVVRYPRAVAPSPPIMLKSEKSSIPSSQTKFEVDDYDYYTSSYDEQASKFPAPAYCGRAYGSVGDFRTFDTRLTLPPFSYVLDISPTRDYSTDAHQMA
ncbi:pheromone A receptor-domain-containing protein [Suillus lakei]|nr:pheromone A receptor-domain-containing protein [Suillus lakei]